MIRSHISVEIPYRRVGCIVDHLVIGIFDNYFFKRICHSRTITVCCSRDNDAERNENNYYEWAHFDTNVFRCTIVGLNGAKDNEVCAVIMASLSEHMQYLYLCKNALHNEGGMVYGHL